MQKSLKFQTKKLLKELKIFPKKSLGQHFLVDDLIFKKILKAINPKREEIIVEVGSGLGILTQYLAKEAKKIIAIEKDDNLAKFLKEKFKDSKKVEILNIDVLEFRPENYLKDKEYKAVGNLPFGIALPTIRLFLESASQPKEIYFLIQKEVAQKICSEKSSLAKITVELYSRPKILFYVSKNSFFPKPKVDGAFLKLDQIKKGEENIDKDLFFKILKACFLHPRKTILNNLSSVLKLEKEKVASILEKLEIPYNLRPENLSLKKWQDLYLSLSKFLY